MITKTVKLARNYPELMSAKKRWNLTRAHHSSGSGRTKMAAVPAAAQLSASVRVTWGHRQVPLGTTIYRTEKALIL
jgi:hypothetical protein